MITFEVLATDGAARRGRLQTPHGPIDTPVFMPVGTAATVKALAPSDLIEAGAQIILGNTYHLYLRPGAERIARLGGLHQFMAWPRALLTDSGGFQVWSLAARRQIGEDGVVFRSHLDGSEHLLSPEKAVDVQQKLGADIVMAFDECPPAKAEREYVERSVDLTTRWARRCLAAWTERERCALFGIVQGALYADIRARHIDEMAALDLPGYALGGYSVGEEPVEMWAGVRESAPRLPAGKPRYLMGVGTPEDLVECAGAGVDMFDCVMPTRAARHGQLFTRAGRITIRNAQYADDERPPDPACACPVCQTFTRAYLRHLYASKEQLSARLNTLHNVCFYLGLMGEIRAAIEGGRYEAFRKEFAGRGRPAAER